MKNRPGAALLLVLWLIIILGALGSSVAAGTRTATRSAGSYRAGVVGRYAAESGVTLATSALEQSLQALADSAARRDYLNRLDRVLGESNEIALHDARAAVALIDLGTRVDLNTTSVQSLTRLFGFFTDAHAAEIAAAAVHAQLPITSLDELELPSELAERALQYLTIDGDGSINRQTASDTVLAAAGGDLRDEPTRIMVVSRGWRTGQPVTHEIQAVYAIQGNTLALVRWRERQL